MSLTDIKNIAKDVFNTEIKELEKVKNKIDNNFEKAVKILYETEGKVIIIGMGKSGLIGKKIAATLSSLGTSSFFVHPAEAIHGDLGMIDKKDTVILISNSGETEEVIRLIPILKKIGSKLIAMTGKTNSTLAKNVEVVIDIGVEKEACPFQLAPTSSTTATLVMGDAIAITLMKLKNFTPSDFALFHPGGSLGKKTKIYKD